MIDGGKLTPGKAVIVPRSSTWHCAAVPVVPTIDAGQFQGQADGGQAGHRVTRGADVPRVPTIDGGKLTPGKAVIVPRSSTWQRAAVPVVPMIDAGQLQGQADGGQAGY